MGLYYVRVRGQIKIVPRLPVANFVANLICLHSLHVKVFAKKTT